MCFSEITLKMCNLFQVGILLHYSTLATALWVGVTARNIYKQVTRKAKRYEELDEPPPPPRPMLRFGFHYFFSTRDVLKKVIHFISRANKTLYVGSFIHSIESLYLFCVMIHPSKLYDA